MSVTRFEADLLLRTILSDRPVKATLFALGFVVFLVIGLYVATVGQPESSVGAAIHFEIGLSRDRSMGEIVSYGMAFLAAILFFMVFVESRSPMFLSLSSLMAFIWFDDSARYHERLGRLLSQSFELPAFPGTRQQDTDELIAWAIAGSILACLFLFSLSRRRSGDLGALGLVMVGFGVLVLFGIVTDIVHIAAPRGFDFLIGVIKDGGEMLAIAFIAGIALGLGRNYGSYCTLTAGRAE
jgi:hypothetical protein